MIVSREILETLHNIYGEPTSPNTPQSVSPPTYTTSSTSGTMKPSFRAYMNRVDESWSTRPGQSVGIGLKLTSVVSLAGKEIIDLDEIKTEESSDKVPPSTTLCSPFGKIAAENVTKPPFWELNTKAVVKVEEIPKSPSSSCHSSSSPLGQSSPSSDSNTDNTSPKSSSESTEAPETMESSKLSQPSKDMFEPITILNADQITCYQQLQEVDNENSYELYHLKFCPICGDRLRKEKYDIMRQSRRLVIRIANHMKVVHSITGENCTRCKAQKYPLFKIPCICRSCRVCNSPLSGNLNIIKHLKFAHGLYKKEVIERKLVHDKKPVPGPDPDAKIHSCLLKSNVTPERSCNYKTSTFVLLSRHIAEVHHVVMHKDPVILKCPLCSFKQQGTAKLASHIRKTHFSADNANHKDKRYKRVNSSLFYFSEEPVVPEPRECAEPRETEPMVAESAPSDSLYEEDLLIVDV